jgi:hypothetical protein
MEWQPIETAPKDRPILIWDGENMISAEWGLRANEWTWQLVEGEIQGDSALWTAPTHWMPLPDAPKD